MRHDGDLADLFVLSHLSTLTGCNCFYFFRSNVDSIPLPPTDADGKAVLHSRIGKSFKDLRVGTKGPYFLSHLGLSWSC